jgi:serine protease Do
MRSHRPIGRWVGLAIVLLGSSGARAQRQAPAAGAFCSGEYAEDLAALAPRVRDFERQPQARYSYCLRNTATYECLSYAPDGGVRHTRRKAVLHGTAFAYRQQGGETLLLTNDHVAAWPAVTDDEHSAEGVPSGCKKVSEALRIVDNESDAYESDDITLSRVVTDPQLDVAVLKAHTLLSILPWRVGHSSALVARDVVQVRGFPLGAFQATNIGKVVSAFDHDDYHDWDHVDFVVDALLSHGNSGSPVLAVSCKTGEFELVGIYHAEYTRGAALNVVIGIDQVLPLMNTLKRTPRGHSGEPLALGGRDRMILLEAARGQVEPFFPFGPLAAVVRARPDGGLVFELFSREFPFKSHPILVLEDLPPHTSGVFGEPGRVWFGGPQGLKGYTRADLDTDAQAQVARLHDALRRDALAAFAYRAASRDASASRERYETASRLERSLSRAASQRRELTPVATDLAEHLSPRPGERAAPLADAFAPAQAGSATSGPEPAAAARDERDVGSR